MIGDSNESSYGFIIKLDDYVHAFHSNAYLDWKKNPFKIRFLPFKKETNSLVQQWEVEESENYRYKVCVKMFPSTKYKHFAIFLPSYFEVH